ncbi:MAG: ribonuclease P protein component [Anaerolineales bacterium]
MERSYRLRSPTDFRRVRREGKSYAHPLVVLVASPNQMATSRFGVTTSRSFRKATERNRAKRRLRHALQPFLDEVEPGWDFVVIARRPILTAPWPDLKEALITLFNQAGAAGKQGSS